MMRVKKLTAASTKFPGAYLCLLTLMLVSYNCMTTSHSDTYQSILDKKFKSEELGKAMFLFGDMGGIYPHTLKSNTFVYKIAVLALHTIDSAHDPQDLFMKYCFLLHKKTGTGKWATARPG